MVLVVVVVEVAVDLSDVSFLVDEHGNFETCFKKSRSEGLK